MKEIFSKLMLPLADHDNNLEEMVRQRTAELEGQLQAALARVAEAEEARQQAQANEEKLTKVNQELLREIARAHSSQDVLEENEQRNRLIADTAHEAFVSMSPDGTIIDWNHQAEETFGWPRQEALGRCLAETIIPPAFRELHQRGLQNYLQTGIGPVLNKRLELTALHRDGHEFPIELSIAPIPWKGSYLFSAFVHDITERKEAEQKQQETAAELARSNAELELFASIASHDLQEPLRMISSYVELLANRYKDLFDEKGKRWIGFAVEGALRMKRLIMDLLEFSRVSTRGQPFEPTDCEEILRTALANLEQAITESGAAITHGPLPTVLADASQLAQLWQNLLGNALKFRSAQSPAIHIEAQKQDENWLFSVTDNGIGLDPQFAERIFVIFQRLHTRAEYPGTGIGLALCQKIVNRHGGKIWVESQPGQGATFWFTLPEGETESLTVQRER